MKKRYKENLGKDENYSSTEMTKKNGRRRKNMSQHNIFREQNRTGNKASEMKEQSQR